ncbi:RNA polymerase, sigma-24 subunit, ECF subfamily [Lachnoclostridium phytofermentans ISDg]|uniref:RNA polymerase, sigma-24 subunit, ECF subfamily n=1 Tax=Lachnoclostridium phytofermentans (strain ATCC 700394 / DSM 18823 / ISDg) TaxID=357809 RepID=A9KLG8_LACP7|nr:RNA polymerase, sigma-24 subunit, ECF subfamily [Lachnoclostridium phytofermentans ISDg]
MQRYYKDIFVYVYRQTQNEELSKDLTQEIFIAMLKSIEGFDAKRASFKTWLYKIASNKIIDSYRSTYYKYVTVVEEIEEGRSSSLSMEDLVVLKEETNDILDIISTLSTSIQQIIRLKIFGEMTFAEIGLLLELSESTVKSKYYAAVKKIKKVMEV